MRSTKKLILMALVGSALALVAMSPVLSAHPGGVGSGNEPYDCGDPCHSVLGSAVVTMWASNLSPGLDADVTVMVNVTGGQATADGFLGVMIITSLSDSSLPSSMGWTITQDPSATATTYNYHEIDAYTGSISMQWKLKAPGSSGTYTLYARAVHGGGAEYYENYVNGLIFSVGNVPPSQVPQIVISSVTPNENLSGSVVVDATVISTKPISYAVLRLGTEVIGNDTSEPFSWTIDTTKLADGTYELNVTAVDTSGGHGYKQITVFITNSASNRQLIDWVWTLAAGSVAILAWIGIMIVVVLMIRRRGARRRGA